MAPRFTLRQMDYLVAVGECGSIALAAKRLNVSSPTISTAISQIEAEFGLAVFVRKHAQGMAATPAGLTLIRECHTVLLGAGRLGDTARALAGQMAGQINFGALLTFAQILVPRLRRSFADLHPQVRVCQSELHQAALIDGLRSAKIDLALTYDLAIPPDLDFLPIAVLPPYVLTGAAHPLAGRSRISVAELVDFPMVLLDLPLSSDYFISFFNKAGLTAQVAERTGDIAVMQSLVANGFGYSIANLRPRSDLAPDGRSLRFIPFGPDVPPLHLGLLMARGGGARQIMRAFTAHAQAFLPGLLAPAPKDL